MTFYYYLYFACYKRLTYIFLDIVYIASYSLNSET